MASTIGPFVSIDETVALTGWSRLSVYRRIVEGELQTRGVSLVILGPETSDIFVSIDEAWAMTGLDRCILYRRIVEKRWPIQRFPQPNHPPIIRIALRALPLDRRALLVALYQCPALKIKGVPMDMAHVSDLVHLEARRRLAILGEAVPLFASREIMGMLAMLDAFCRQHEVSADILGEWHQAERWLMAICSGTWIE